MTSADDAMLAGVSRETVARLREFEGLVMKWTVRINLVSAASVPHLWERHILDSVQLYQFAPDQWQHWVDLGSGGGFPAIPLTILAHEKQPRARFTLIESDQRKATFLRSAIRELGLSAAVLDQRIEAVAPLRGDVLTARALAPLDRLLSDAVRHLAPTGRALFPKGRAAAEEIEHARKAWTFDLVAHPSQTESEAQILQIERIIRA